MTDLKSNYRHYKLKSTFCQICSKASEVLFEIPFKTFKIKVWYDSYMGQSRRQRVFFKATKIVSKPTKVEFRTKAGNRVEFKAVKNVPKSVKVEFLAKKKNETNPS